MNMHSGLLSSKVLRLACVLATAAGMTSCKSPNAGGSPYASSDAGGYNPYPGGGATQNGSLLPGGQPRYAEAPPPPPPGYDGPSGNFQTQPTKRSYSGSGSGSSKSKSKSSNYSSSGSSSKKKGSSSSGGYVYSGGSVHIVRAGDTLYAIADHNHTTVAKLKSLNKLKSNVLKVGQKIKVR